MSLVPPARPRVAFLVIGDEILSGKVTDTNSPWLASRCRALGLELQRIVVLPDVLDEVATAVAEWSARCDFVFTSGGVGPTHDDLTMAAIARGLGRPVERHPELEQVLRDRMGTRYTPAAGRMADVPSGAELWWDGEVRFPQVVVGNVIVFPGVPALLRLKFDAIAHRLGGTPVHSAKVTTTLGESELADDLAAIQARFPNVSIGSYPQFDQKPWTVTITVDSSSEADMQRCMGEVTAFIGDQVL